jgi:drug/metabolite transporter (DMT)-like permease
MTGIVLAIYASFFLALSQGSLKKSYREFPASVAFAFDALFGVLLWVPLAIILGIHPEFLLPAIPYAIVSAILSEALYFYALTKGQLSIAAILLGSYAIYTLIFSFLLNGERLTNFQLIAVLVTIMGTLIVYWPSKLSSAELKKTGAVLWPLAAAVGIGFSDAWSKRFINQTNDYSFLFVLALVQIPVAIIYLRIERQEFWGSLRATMSQLTQYKQALAGSFFNIVGTGFLWLSFSLTLASIASPITATSGAIAALFGIFLLDERLTWKSAIGLLMVFAGILAISFTT